MPQGRILSYRDLDVWREAMALVGDVYRLTQQFPRQELFGLTSQLRRAAVSVPSNIAEGNGRQRRRDYVRFTLVARGSLQELETQLLLAIDLGYVAKDVAAPVVDRVAKVSRMLSGLTRALARLPHDSGVR